MRCAIGAEYRSWNSLLRIRRTPVLLPRIDLALGSLTRTPHGRFPEYHTSADDLSLVRPEAIAGSLSAYLAVVGILEANARYVNHSPKCEPQLGKRGTLSRAGGLSDPGRAELAMLWVLNLADGSRSLLDIADRSGLDFPLIRQVANVLVEHGLLKERGNHIHATTD